MVFSSTFFILYFLPLFFIAYYVIPKKHKNLVLLIASIFFYAWGAPKFIFILLLSLLIDFYLVRATNESNNIRIKKIILTASIIINIGLLGYFKYANFFVENINLLVSNWEANGISDWTTILLPIGISFITFHKITYSIDTYRGLHKPLELFSDYVLYIIMFPHQIAGPIVRYSEVAEQIKDREHETNTNNISEGIFRFIIGLSKKVIIANPLGQVVNDIFNLDINDLSTPIAWIGIIAYTFQIYFDFSGYSDMGIGLAKMIGFNFPENFNSPYISKSITEFWRRWHITLGRFMKDYLYIPLGGNKVSKYRMLLNLWIVFLISGLWHGASWTFVIWGAYHGLHLILDRLFLLRFYSGIGKYVSVPFTFLFVMIGWVFFRAETLNQAFGYINKLFSFGTTNNIKIVTLDNKFWTVIILSVLVTVFPLIKDSLSNFFKKWSSDLISQAYTIIKMFILLILLFISISNINASDFNPFIYYRF